MSRVKVRCGNWTLEETELIANVLTGKDNRFVASLERLALKIATNKEVFDHIKKIFNRERRKKDFKVQNEEKDTFAIRTEICKVTRLLIHQLIN